MKSEPYAQFISRNSVDLSDMMHTFHEVNFYYGKQFLLTLDSSEWELYDLRVSRAIIRFPFKKLLDFTLFMKNLMHDMCTIRILDSWFNGSRKLKRTELYSCRRILNLYGFDDYFISNKKLLNYIIHAELERQKNKNS